MKGLPTLPDALVPYAKCSWAYTKAQMIAYGQASRKAALEDAAKAIASVCSEQATDWGDGYNQGAILCEIKVRNLL